MANHKSKFKVCHVCGMKTTDYYLGGNVQAYCKDCWENLQRKKVLDEEGNWSSMQGKSWSGLYKPRRK